MYSYRENKIKYKQETIHNIVNLISTTHDLQTWMMLGEAGSVEDRPSIRLLICDSTTYKLCFRVKMIELPSHFIVLTGRTLFSEYLLLYFT